MRYSFIKAEGVRNYIFVKSGNFQEGTVIKLTNGIFRTTVADFMMLYTSLTLQL